MRLKVEVGASLDALTDVTADVQVLHYQIGIGDLGAFGQDPTMRPGTVRLVCRRELMAGHRFRLTVLWGDADTPLLSTPKRRLYSEGDETAPVGRVILTGWVLGPGRPDYGRGGWEYEAGDALAWAGDARWWTGIGQGWADHGAYKRSVADFEYGDGYDLALVLNDMLGMSTKTSGLEDDWNYQGVVVSRPFGAALRGDTVRSLMVRSWSDQGLLGYVMPDGDSVAQVFRRGWVHRLAGRRYSAQRYWYVVLTPVRAYGAEEGQWASFEDMVIRHAQWERRRTGPLLPADQRQVFADIEYLPAEVLVSGGSLRVALEVDQALLVPQLDRIDLVVDANHALASSPQDNPASWMPSTPASILPREIESGAESGVSGVVWSVVLGPVADGYNVRVFSVALRSKAATGLSDNSKDWYRLGDYTETGVRGLTEAQRRNLRVVNDRDQLSSWAEGEASLKLLHRDRRLVRFDLNVDDDAELLGRLMLADVVALADDDAFATYYPFGVCCVGLSFDVGRIGDSERFTGRGRVYGLTRDVAP